LIQLVRPPLPVAASDYLDTQTTYVNGFPHGQRKQKAADRWTSKSPLRFAAVRAALEGMCSGHVRCMYCEDSRGTDIDHFEPKANAPERAFQWENYLLACSYCNSNEKRRAFPKAGSTPLLVDPTDPADSPSAHIAYSPTTGEYEGIAGSPKADATLKTFGINGRTLPRARRQAWILMELNIVGFADAKDAGDDDRADRVRDAAVHQPFAGVLTALVLASASVLSYLVHPACRDAIARYPEVAAWL
jgi:uncharacterized protein (TIGR02646 family)